MARDVIRKVAKVYFWVVCFFILVGILVGISIATGISPWAILALIVLWGFFTYSIHVVLGFK